MHDDAGREGTGHVDQITVKRKYRGYYLLILHDPIFVLGRFPQSKLLSSICWTAWDPADARRHSSTNYLGTKHVMSNPAPAGQLVNSSTSGSGDGLYVVTAPRLDWVVEINVGFLSGLTKGKKSPRQLRRD